MFVLHSQNMNAKGSIFSYLFNILYRSSNKSIIERLLQLYLNILQQQTIDNDFRLSKA